MISGRHAVLFLAYNQLELTKAALASVAAQDCGPLEIFVVNNGSTDGTAEWLVDFQTFADAHQVRLFHYPQNESPVAQTNRFLGQIFRLGHERVLMVPNDVVLPPNAYREMDRWPRGIVAASPTDQKEFPRVESARAVSENTPMSLILLRRWCWEALMAKDGYLFDERFFNYASDCDLALRLAACGIHGVQLGLQYWHYFSGTLKLAPEIERKGMDRQANVDRAAFAAKWGFQVSDERYSQLASDINFRGEPQR